MSLAEKVVLITGASSGIGEATARRLATRRTFLVLAARRLDRLEQLALELTATGAQVHIAATDVTDRASVEACVQQALREFGRIDVLVNNAGVAHLSMVEQLRYAEWMTMIDVNLKGALNMLDAVLPYMMARRQGHVVNVSSLAGRKVFPGGAVYSLTKFGLRALSEGLKQELTAPYNIRVTVLEPGTVKTEFVQHVADEALHQKYSEFLTQDVLEPDDIAAAIEYALEQPARVNVTELKIEPSLK
jgi:NADP-dependent 3-hydroxy acid dehydrogenase YdfG